MATIYRCDRCKKDQDDKLSIWKYYEQSGQSSDNDARYELCNYCSKEVVNLINTNPYLPAEDKHIPPEDEPVYFAGNKDEEKDDIPF